MEWIQYVVILLVLIIISLIVLNAECNMSRFKVILKDVSSVDKAGIQKLGAKGIVEIENQLKIIFGKDAKQLKECIKDIIK